MNLSKFRQLTQLTSTVLSNSYVGTVYTKTVNANPLKGICVPFLNCYACPTALFSCPIGTIQHFAATRVVPFYLLSYIFLIGIFTGRMACGWLCPFGFLQDLMHKLPSPKYKVPDVLKYMKYLVLLFLVIVIPYYTGECWFSKVCPAGTLTAGIPWAVWNPVNPANGQQVLPYGPGLTFYVSLLILIGFLTWFVFSRRPFCKAACPMGAMLSFFNRYSILKLEVANKCDDCNVCLDSCPMDLNVALEVDSGECIRCLECTRCGHVKLTSTFSMPEEAVNS